MLIRAMLLFEPFSLNASSNDLYRMSNCSREHSASNTCSHLINSPLFELLVHHVVESPKKTFLPAGGGCSTKKCHEPLFSVNVENSTSDASVLMEICQLVSCFNDVERVR